MPYEPDKNPALPITDEEKLLRELAPKISVARLSVRLGHTRGSGY
jgi:hypothetical protein